ncbi:MAG: DUF4393 domain-containing protein [Helicobacter sp.]|nr:DUF4393 domain-containing protein [Helicobacter sp.]
MPIDIKFDLTEPYKDALQPAMKQIGGALGDLAKTARLLLVPLSLCGIANDRFQKWCDRMRNEVKEENMTEAEPNILIPTLSGLAINPDETLLGEMFFNILKSSIDKTKQKFLSPAFPKILEQISKDEAKILTLLKIHQHINYACYMSTNENNMPEEECIEIPYNIDKDLFPIYKDHLALLGLLTSASHQPAEAFFDTNWPFGLLKSLQKQSFIMNNQIKFYKNVNKCFYRLELNGFGKAFVEVCITKKCEEFLRL